MKIIISLAIVVILALSLMAGCAEDERYEMFAAVLKKDKNEDFIIMNISDPQLISAQWNENSSAYKSLKFTVDELVKKLEPDLITVSGDIMDAPESNDEIRFFAAFLDSYGIPWAPVWGNHDYNCGKDGGIAQLEANAEVLSEYENCLFEVGAVKNSSGNYIIGIEEKGQIVEAVFMMDCLDRGVCGTLGNAVTIPMLYEQETLPHLDWYSESIAVLKELGCTDSTLITHIPLNCYSDAIEAAYKNPKCTLEESYTAEPWNEGYEDSFGVWNEGPTGISFDDLFFEEIKENGTHTKHVLTGHDHYNNFSINYEGIQLTYAMKTGPGASYINELRGCTVIKVGSEGVSELYHEYHHW